MSSIADRVRKLRGDLSQAAFAKRLLISRDYLSQIENGREPSPRLVQQIELLERVGLAPEKADSVGITSEKVVNEGANEDLEAEIRRFIEDLLSSAAGDRSRLGWIREQLQAHLHTPAHWRKTSSVARETEAALSKVLKERQTRYHQKGDQAPRGSVEEGAS